MAARHEMHGCTRRETLILDRAEAGEPFAAIAADMGVTATYVERTVKYYNSGLDSDLAARRSAVRANALYLAAIAATGRSFG